MSKYICVWKHQKDGSAVVCPLCDDYIKFMKNESASDDWIYLLCEKHEKEEKDRK